MAVHYRKLWYEPPIYVLRDGAVTGARIRTRQVASYTLRSCCITFGTVGMIWREKAKAFEIQKHVM